MRTVEAADRRGFALVLLGAVLWGTGGVAGAALGEAAGLGPVAVAGPRLAAGAVALAAVLAVGRSLVLPRRADVARRVVVVGLLLAAYQLCYFAAVAATSVAVATLVALGAAPVLVAAATALRRRARPAPREIGAVVLAVAGLAVLLGPDLARGAGSAAGAALAPGAAAAFAAVTLVQRRPLPGVAPPALTAAGFVVGALALAPWTVLGPAGWPAAEGPAGTAVVVGLVAFLGLVPTAAAWAAYFTGLRSVPATAAAVLALGEPLTATLVAAVVLDQPVGWATGVGGLALAAATVTVRRVGTDARERSGLAYDGRRSAPTVRQPGGRRPVADPPPSGAGR